MHSNYSDISYRADILDGILKLFRKFNITEELINSVTDIIIPLETQNIILNELSKYGIFNSTESNSVLNLLFRLRNTGNIFKYKEILQLESASISVQAFHDLLIDYCLTCDLFGVINLCSLDNRDTNILLSLEGKSNELLELIISVHETAANPNNTEIVKKNVLKVCQYLNCDIASYFKTHPILLVLLVLFDSNLNSPSVIDGATSSVVIDNVEINFDPLFSSFPTLKVISDKFQKHFLMNTATVWQLLANNTNLNVNFITEFVESIGSVPHFNCQKLFQEHGYKKSINSIYFLKQCQPSKACRMFLAYQEMDKAQARLKAENLAVKNFADITVSAAAIVFLEMCGESSTLLKVHLEAINIVFELLPFEKDEIVLQFLQVNNNPELVANILETAIMKTIRLLDARKNFLGILKKYQIMIKFCKLHNLNLPEQLLRLFAVNNLWLPFLIFAQMHNYPLHQIRKLVQNFKNPTLLEHVNHSVLHNIDLDAFMGKRNTRTSLYAKLGVHHKKPTASEEAMHTSTSSLSSHDSIGSIASSGDSLDQAEADALDMKATLLQTLIRCHNSADPPRALLHAAQLYRNPLLAVLASIYEVGIFCSVI